MIDEIAKAREQNNVKMHKYVKRKLIKRVACIKCHKPHILSDKTVGFQCPYCGKYQSDTKGIAQFKSGEINWDGFENKGGKAPGIKTSDGKDYSNLRDEYEIRADMFAQGKTRDSMGYDKFDNTLRRELIKNKCYRGPEKTGLG